MTDNTEELDERILSIPEVWAEETVTGIKKLINDEVARVLDMLKEPTINDVFPSKPYDGTHTHSDMVAVVKYYEGLIEAERNKLKESK